MSIFGLDKTRIDVQKLDLLNQEGLVMRSRYDALIGQFLNEEVVFVVDSPIKQLFWNQQEFWSGRGDLNARPPAPKAGALPGCATPRHFVLS